MSRLGKKPIVLPSPVTATLAGGVLTVKGPKGEISRTFTDDITMTVGAGEITLVPARESNYTRALWGTYAAHIYNMITGVTEGFTKKLEIEGVGYRAAVKGEGLELMIGFSHPVLVAVPKDLAVSVEKNVITVSGIDKEQVGQFAAIVRLAKPPEPYKGKGIHYAGEYILRKQGKRATA
ncbi:50S ribosomal protein L6 [Candidatus Kaiserbacteria bacterium]|nr:50S ribosomal protein L6 [Candidatus Kaiserbacteria bacterium]